MFLLSNSTTPTATPVATFTSSCAKAGCTFDATPWTDPDGGTPRYKWSFGDGRSASTVTNTSVTHRYATNGSFTVTLTVTTTSGASASQSSTVDIDAPAKTAAFVGQRAGHGSGHSLSVALPKQAKPGTTAVLMVTYGAKIARIAKPKGWSLADERTHGGLGTAIYTDRIGRHSARKVVVGFDHTTHSAAVVAAYSKVSSLAVERAKSSTDDATKAHPAPALHNLTAGSLGIGFWAERPSKQPNWSLPRGTRHRVYAKGGGIGLAVGQAAAAIKGSYSPGTAHTRRKVSAVHWTIALSPALK
jgi:PKD repeat protein